MKVRYTVPSDASRVGYSTNGSTTVFSVPFVFFDDTDLQVILVNNTTAVETVLTLTTNYTVTGGAGSTGSLTTVSTYASGSTLVIQREVPYTQEIDYQANDGFPAEVNEEGLDRSTMQIQQVRRRARQTPKLPATYDPESGDITLPMPVSGKVLAGNSDEDGWENVDAFEGGTDLPTLISTIQNLDLLEYNASGSVWRNRTRAQVLGDLLPLAGGTMTGTLAMSGAAINEAVRVDVASATTCAIGAAASNYVRITGTTTITGLGTVASGIRRKVVFAGALTLTHNATSLILPTGANITTAAGDTAEFISEGSGNWRCTDYQRAIGLPAAGGILQRVSTLTGTYSSNAATIPIDNTTPQSSEGTELLTQAFTPKSASSTLVVDVTLVLGCTTSVDTGAIALFQDSGTDAIAANAVSLSGFADPKTLRYEVASGSTTARTFKVRAGCNTNTLLFNGVNTVGAIMNGLCQSFISITEIAA
jgi:hypothetical protein